MTLGRNGTWTAATSATGTGTLTVTLPTHAVGNLLVVAIVGKQYNAALTTPTGWAQQGGTFTNGTTAAGTDVGSLFVRFYTRVATVTNTANPAFTLSGGNSSNVIAGAAIAVTSDVAGATFALVSTSGSDATTDTNLTCTGALIALTAEDVLIGCMGSPSDAGSWNTTLELTATGISGWTFNSANSPSNSGNEFVGGGQLSAFYRYRKASAGTATAGPNMAVTATASGAWAQGLAGFLRVRESAPVGQNYAQTLTDDAGADDGVGEVHAADQADTDDAGAADDAVHLLTRTAALDDDAGARDVLRVRPDPYGHAVAADTPRGWWRLDEAAGPVAVAETVPPARDGTYTGGVTPGAAALVRRGVAAAAFDGSSGYVAVPAEGMNLGNAFTVEAWFRPDPATKNTATDRWIWRYGVFLRFRGTNGGQIRGGFFGPGGERQAIADALNGTGGLPDVYDGLPHHAVVTYDGTTIRVYVDAQLDVELAVTDTVNYSSTPSIGRNAGFAEGYWHGGLDEVAVYPVALSAERILAHYEAGGPYLFIDAAGATDAAVQAQGHDREATDAAGAVDSVAASLTQTATATDAAGAADAAVQAQGHARELTDAAGAADAAVQTVAATQALADAAGAADATTAALARTLDDQAGAADVADRTSAAAQTLADDAGAADSVAYAASGAAAQTYDDLAGAADALAQAATTDRALTDGAGAADSATAALALVATDAAGVADAAAQTAAAAQVLADDAGVADAVLYTASGAAAQTATDAAGAADAATAALSVPRAATDAAGVTDLTSANALYVAVTADDAGHDDGHAAALDRVVATADDAGADDALAVAVTRAMVVADDAGTADDVVYTSVVRNITVQAGPPRRREPAATAPGGGRTAGLGHTAREVTATRVHRTAGAGGGTGRAAAPAGDQ